MMKLEKGTFSVVPVKMCKGLPPMAQVVFMWLCCHANNSNQCFPSLKTLAEECGMSKDSVVRSLKFLEDIKYIEKEIRVGKDGDNISNLYTVNIFEVAAISDNVAAISDNPLSANSTPLAADVDTNYINITKSKKPKLNSYNTPKSSIDYSPEFSNVWDNIYPHMSDKGSKAQTYKNWCGLLKTNSSETLASAAHNYKAHCQIKKETFRYKCSNFYGEMRYFENFMVLNLTTIQQEASNEQRNTNTTTSAHRCASGAAFIRRLAEAEAAGFDINDF